MGCDKDQSLPANCASDLFRQVAVAICDSNAFDGRIGYPCGGELAPQYCTRLGAQIVGAWCICIDQPDSLAVRNAQHRGHARS